MAHIPYIITQESAQYYECGFSCDNAIVICADDVKFFITDSRYTLEAKQFCNKTTEVIESSDFCASVADIIAKQGFKEIVFDSQAVVVSFYEELKLAISKHKCNLTAKPNFHQQLRIYKTPKELKLIADSQKLNKKAFKRFARYLSRIVSHAKSEQELHYEAMRFLSFNGKYALSFEHILGINANGAKPHALPSPKVLLHKGDLLLFDAGIKYKRYCSDMTRTAYIGNEVHFKKTQHFKDRKKQKIYDIVRKAQENAISKARSGMSGKEIDALARDVIEKAGYGKYFIHSTGHGIGLDIHELPRISRKSDDIIENGMVFSIEPGIYLPSKFGVRIEDLVVMKNGRADIL